MFELNQMPSVWPDAEGKVALTHWPVAAATMEARMREVGMLALYGTREAGTPPARRRAPARGGRLQPDLDWAAHGARARACWGPGLARSWATSRTPASSSGAC